MLRADPGRQVPVRSTRETWFDHGVIALALVLLLFGYGTIVTGNDWWVTTILVASMTGLTCAVLRGLGFRLVAPVAVLVEFLALTWIFVPETLSSIIPTTATFSALNDLLYAARMIIVEEQAPVGAGKPIVLVMAMSFGLIVIVADFLLQRKRAAPLVGVLLVAVYATPALVSGTTPSVWLFISVAALWLVLLRSRTATTALAARGSSPALVLGSGALVAAVIFPLVSPDVSAVATAWGKPPSTVFGRGINPMLELGQNLRRNSSVTSLTYTTTLDSAPYLKVATLRDFTGKTWKPAEADRFDGLEGQAAIYRNIEVEQARTTITIRNLRSSMLPVPYPAVDKPTGLEGDWQLQRVGQTVASRTDDSRGEVYTVTSLDRKPTADQMRSLTPVSGPRFDRYRELPNDLPDIIRQTAREVTADADNDYDRALALQSWFRSTGGFTYSETAPVAEDYDGNGMDVIAKFLDVKAGYCVHFSSAMAVMARTLDIPARIAVGYAPGSTIGSKDGLTEYESTSDDLHAWPELYFQGVGWVQFEPTTSIGSPTSFNEPVSDTPTPDAPDPTPTPGSTSQRGADRVDSGATPEAAPAPTTTASRSALVVVPVLLLFGALPWLVRSAQRRWRISRGRHHVDPLWDELGAVVRDHGIVASAADTPRGFAARLRLREGLDVDALDRLLRRVERTRFAKDGALDGDGVDDLRAVTASIRAGATRGELVRATLLPSSITGRTAVLQYDDGTTLAT